jgi:hypothetical protein
VGHQILDCVFDSDNRPNQLAFTRLVSHRALPSALRQYFRLQNLDFQYLSRDNLAMRDSRLSGISKVLIGFVFGASLFSGGAVAYNAYVSDNTPEGGYLLCANKKTKVVTYANKLVCPSGTLPLDLGALERLEGPRGPQGPQGIQGIQGPQGPQGPAGRDALSGIGKSYWGRMSAPLDIVADGNITSGSQLVRRILFTMNARDVPPGYYSLRASIGGLWGDASRSGNFAQCYFQDDSDYKSNSGAKRWGVAAVERGNWNFIQLNVLGDWLANETIHLVCGTSGTLKGVDAYIEATRLELGGKFAGSAN